MNTMTFPDDNKPEDKPFRPKHIEAQVVACTRCGKTGIGRIKIGDEVVCGSCRTGTKLPLKTASGELSIKKG